MYPVLLVIHTIVVLFMIALILIQRSDQDGMGLSGGGGNQFLSGRSQANLLTRTTAILAAVFIVSSLVLAVMGGRMGRESIVDTITQPAPAVSESPVQEPAKAESPPKPSVPRPE